MLKHLTISNYVLIRELDMDFPSGLVLITGETGAGKSIMLGALSLLLGKKADSSVFGDGGRNCVVEGEFDVNGEETILRRVISPNGRSRSFVNDEPVSASVLAEMSSSLVDVHEQHQSRLLSDPDYQLDILDGYAGNGELLAAYSVLWKELQGKRTELSKLKDAIAAASRDRDYRQFQFDQLSEAGLKDGELEELEEESRVLSNAEMIMGELSFSLNSLREGETPVAHSLKNAASSLQKVEKFIPEMSELSQRLAEARIEIEDIESDIERFSEKVAVSPARLEEVNGRIDVITTLLKKHDVQTVGELIAVRDELESLLSGEENDGMRAEELEREIAGLEGAVAEKALELSERRRAAAKKFSAELQASVRELEMPTAEFEIAFEDKTEPGCMGTDRIKFMFAANGNHPGELSKVASGGELSRVMLALKKLISEYSPLPTMIFDEIDTGVSGRMADRMGKMIAGMGEKMQIFAITHLPQIASQKGAHYLIEKKTENGEAVTSIRLLSEKERVSEVARMLSGDTLTEAAVRNAESLLGINNQNK